MLGVLANNAQIVMDSRSMSYEAVLDTSNARVMCPEYDEIKDEQYIEIISSEKPLRHFEDKSVEFTKSSNDQCFTLMPQEEQTEAITKFNVNTLCSSMLLATPR